MHALAHLGHQPVHGMHIEQRAYPAAVWPWRLATQGFFNADGAAGPGKISKLIMRLTTLPSCRHHK